MQFREQPIYEDMEAVASILKNSGFFNEEEQDVGVSLVRERLEQGEKSLYFFQFAQEGAQVLGYTCFGPIPGTRFSYDLYWIAVDPAYQRQGIGGLLLQQTEAQIERRGGKRIYIETSSQSLYLPTRSFYTRHGYILEGQLKDYYAPGDDKLLYVKGW
ncbi:MAG TPA: N-acetyltransferase [Sphaerochaeta sp.]|jgi:ribosomal protein S18 acetylase RimI-like enzyme|nr:N-acetyltransferase [Sphaerochaeta sp.]